nr:MAG TPA: minor tail protein [Caudoviricetes sp.]
MSEDLAKLKVTIEGDSKSFKREMSQSEAEAKKACNAIKKAMNNISFKNTAGDKLAAPWKQVGKRIKSTITDIRAGELKESMKDYVKEAQLASGIRVYTDDYLRIKDDIDRTNKSLEKLQQKKRDLQARKEDTSGIDTQIAATQRQVRRYNSDRITMIARGQDTERVTSSKLSSGSGLETAGATASYSLKQIPAKMKEITSSVSNTVKNIPVLGTVIKNTAYVGSKALGGLRTAVNLASKGWGGLKRAVGGLRAVFNSVSTVIRRTSGAFAALIQKFTSGIPVIGRARRSMNGMGQSGRGLRGILSTLGMTAKFMFASFIIQGALSGAKEGMQNLSKYSKQANADLSLLMSSLTQLKNSLATAFAPILTVITPILNTLIQKIITVVNAFGQLTASLAGQITFVKAKKVNQDYAASLDKSSKKAKNLQRTLMGFDEINKLDDKSSSDSSDSGGLSPNDMFKTVKIPNKYKDLAKMLKDAWTQGDFTKIGQMLGKKVNEALESIPWDRIKKTCNKIAKSIATFLNGFIETVDWGLVGNTISQGLNTAFGFANTFAKNFHWDSLGKAIGDGINGAMEGIDWNLIQETVRNVVGGIVTSINTFIKTTKWKLVGKTIGNGLNTALEAVYTAVTNFKWKKAGKALADAINGLFDTFDWAKAGKTLSNGIKGILDFAITALENIKWDKAVKGIEKFFENIDWTGIANRVFELIGAAFGGLAALLGGLIGDAVEGAQKYFKKKIEECGGNIPKGILKGIKDGIKNIAKWIKDNIFKPFIDGFKKAFGIHSPSTVMAEQGAYIISGLLKGLKNKIKEVLSWLAKLPGEFKAKLGNAKEWLVDKGKDAIAGIKNGWNAVKKSNLLDYVAKIKNEIYQKIGDVKGKVTSRGKEVITGLKNGLDNNWKTMSNVLSNLPSKISKAIPNLYKTGKNAIQNFADGFASVRIKLPHISTTWNKHEFGNLSFSTPSFSLNWYAKGGFPEAGEMFVARERGPEMVGRIGNKNAVANNNQIVDAIRAGVFEAMVNALESFSSDKNQSTDVHIYLEGDSKKLFKVVRKEGQQYQKSTGKAVFS